MVHAMFPHQKTGHCCLYMLYAHYYSTIMTNYVYGDNDIQVFFFLIFQLTAVSSQNWNVIVHLNTKIPLLWNLCWKRFRQG